MACGYECCLVADVGNVGTRESWCLASQEVDVKVLVQLQGLQVYYEYLPALVQVGQLDVYLAVKASCAHEC